MIIQQIHIYLFGFGSQELAVTVCVVCVVHCRCAEFVAIYYAMPMDHEVSPFTPVGFWCVRFHFLRNVIPFWMLTHK